MLTPKQERVLMFIRNYISSNQCSPTLSEIGRYFQFRSSATVAGHVAALEREGLIKRIPNVSRGIQIVSNGSKAECGTCGAVFTFDPIAELARHAREAH